MLNLVDEKLAKVSHIHFGFRGIHNSNCAVQLYFHIGVYILYCFHNIGKLAHTRGLNENTLRLIGIQNLF